MDEILHTFAFLKHKHKLRLAYSPQSAILTNVQFNLVTEEFLEQYRDAEAKIPNDAPDPRGNSMESTNYVDASHAANKDMQPTSSTDGCTLVISSLPNVHPLFGKASSRRQLNSLL